MKTLFDACKPRKSIFDRSRRDTVLDLSDLLEGKIDAKKFFEENFLTDGMKRLLRESFRRFNQTSDQGTFVLSQAMGGGKTHNMLSLALLAQNPEIRKDVMGDLFEGKDPGNIRVIGFSGRETDAPLGIWGSLAQQLGKKDLFKDYYSPLQAPGQSAWINLLKGDPLLILLDELPPYFQNARSKTVGNTDLSVVTATALSNLLVAVSKAELSNVCVVISDLRSASYQDGSATIVQALEDFRSEVGRGALTLEPVGLNTDELYHILRKRIFKGLPEDSEIKEVAEAYAKAVKDAKQMDITSASPEQFQSQLIDSYPFHFSIKDLYARFRENPGFQQTRGLIRFMRVVVSRLWESKKAENIHLIHAHDIDLNDSETLGEIQGINSTLDNAIAHDIASKGSSVAESFDKNSGDGTDAQDVLKLLLVSSLANIPNAIHGLSVSEVISHLCQPGRDISKLPKEVLGVLTTKAWYLHSTRDGKLFFKNVENLVAKLKTRAENYNRESAIRELRTFLGQLFDPNLGDCYQTVQALPAVDEIKVEQSKVNLIVVQPSGGSSLHQDLETFYQNETLKNRVLFLSGEKETMASLIENSSEYKAITSILQEMDAEKVPGNDPQRTNAEEMLDKIKLRLLSSTRESFTKLYYPSGKENALLTADFLMNFSGNDYNGEKQIKEALSDKQKFTTDVDSDMFRKKCEDRLFTQKQMPYNEIMRRAAITTKWQWHHPSALEQLKNRMILEDRWREDGGYLDKGPFPAPQSSVFVQVLKRNDDTGEVTLKIVPKNADVVHYEIGSDATTGSMKIDDLNQFVTSDLKVSFLAVDSKENHETGSTYLWKNVITLKQRLYQSGNDKMCELKAAPDAEIKYTTDGSDPKNSGGLYEGDFIIPDGTRFILAVAEKDGIEADPMRIEIPAGKNVEQVKVTPEQPAKWKRKHKNSSTRESYDFFKLLAKHGGKVRGVVVSVQGTRWAQVDFDPNLELTSEQVETVLSPLRALMDDGEVEFSVDEIRFDSGQQLLDWVEEVKTELKSGEVEQ